LRGCFEIIDWSLAMFTKQKRLAPLDPDQGDEKQAQIMVHPGGIGLCKAAGWTPLRVFVQSSGFGLDTGN
jgi:hypothetical protein